MTEKEQRPAAGGTADTGLGTSGSGKRSTPRPEAKWRRTLREILSRSLSPDPQAWLHRFAAESICRDHTLPSTVSELQSDKGLSFERHEVTVAGYAGEPARVMAYRLAPESIQRAITLLASP